MSLYFTKYQAMKTYPVLNWAPCCYDILGE